MAESGQPKGKIEFLQFHQPALRDGNYTIEIKQTISYPGKIAADNSFKTAIKKFRVAGERFTLNPLEIQTVFPPDNSSGDHSMVIPHIVLNRSTLPWERFAESGDEETPWLALLVFTEEEIAQVKAQAVPFSQLAGTAPGEVLFPTLAREQEKDEDQISVIDMPWQVLQKQLPSREELRLQTHVRQAKDESGNLEGPEVTVLLANRLPEPGKITTVHLVSLEECFGAGVFHAASAADTDKVRLVTLKNWRFSCEKHKGSFSKIVRDLNLDPPYLHLPLAGGALQPVIDAGAVPVEHLLRDGGQTISLYNGPLAGIRNNVPPGAFLTLPATAADSLLYYFQNHGIFSTGYAAAWELGRLLTLRNNRVATELFQWKRNHVQELHRAEQVLAHPHLPGHQQEPPEVQALQLPEVVEAWFDDLRLLVGLPFNYLVPDEAMLPVESLRIFQVDPFWVAALMDGAFSLGRVTGKDHETDGKNGEQLFNFEELRNNPVTGVLIRSEVVSGWPDLLIDGYARPVSENPPQNHPDDKLPLLRQERLSDGIVMCLFSGIVQTIDVHQKPETVHFGLVESENDPPQYYKPLRKDTGEETDRQVRDIPWRSDVPAARILDIKSFAEKIDAARREGAIEAPPPITSALFALEMIEGVQKVRFSINAVQNQ